MNNVKMVELARKYDRSIVVVATAISTIFVAYFSVKAGIDKVISSSPVIIELQNTFAEQAKFNASVVRSLEKIETRIEKGDEKFDRKFDMIIGMLKEK